jgi:hypothetical protein
MYRLMAYLRVTHPYVWTELGEPRYSNPKSSFDLVGRLTPYLRSPSDPIATDERVRRLILVRRVCWWLAIITIVVGSMLGYSMTIYRSNEPFSMPLYAGAVIAVMVGVVVWQLWRRRRVGR